MHHMFAFFIALCLFQSAMTQEGRAAGEATPATLVEPRDGLGNVLTKLREGKPVKIAYFGGSITAANGWRVQTLKWFKERFPKADVSEINAAIGGTGSDLGVFRLGRDVLVHKPDFVFVEFAVNDGGASPEMIRKTMEGIVRQIWAADSHTDICFIYTYRTGYEKELRTKLNPRAAATMEEVAAHYGISSINVALKTVELESASKLVFQADKPEEGKIHFSSDGVHPLDAGHRVYAEVIDDAIAAMEKSAKPLDHALKLAKAFVPDHWQAAKMIPVTKAMLGPEWKALPADHVLAKSFGTLMGTIWEADEAGAALEFKFRGSTARIYDLLAPDGGQVIVKIDNLLRAKPVPRFDSYSTYSRLATLPLAEGLNPEAVHSVTVLIHPDQPDRKPVAFRLKDPETELKSPKYTGTKVRVGQIMLLGELVE